MKHIILLPAFILFATSATAQTLDSTTLSIDTIISTLDKPWEIKLAPSGQIWTTERYGRISRIDPQTGMQDVVLDHSATVVQNSESGMLGMVLHPDFQSQPFVYVVYTFGSPSNILERLSRWEYDGTSLINETILIDSIDGASNHDGSRLLVLQDSTLLMTTGDALDKPSAQNPNSLNGKVLRLNLDGSIPADNPDPNSYVYSSGHRNAQGLVLHPNGKIYSSEHGPTTDDEFNLILKDRNYGWPNVEGFCDLPSEMQFCQDSNVVEPLFAWTPTIAPSDIDYYGSAAIPEWENSILMAVLKDQSIYSIQLDSSGNQVVSTTEYLAGQFGRIRDVLTAPDGSVYIATNGMSRQNTPPFTMAIIRIRNQSISIAEEKFSNPNVAVFPNPAKDAIFIENVAEGNYDFEIYNSQSKKVKSGAFFFDGNPPKIDIENLSKGMYFLMVKRGGHFRVKKFWVGR